MKLPNQPATPAVGRYRWTITALIFAATTINYIDRQILSLIKPILDQELKWTNEEFGLVNGAFQGAYAVGLLFFGWFVDRFGEKIGYTVSIVSWSVAAIGHSLVSSVTGFFVARTALGLGEAGNFPSAVKATAAWFPQRERAFATTLFNAGTNVGPILAPAIVPWIALTWGWQMAFVVAGVAGFLWLLLWIPFYTQPENNKNVSEAELKFIQSDRPDVTTGPKSSWLGLMKYRQTWSFIVAKFMTDPVWWFFLIWLPDYFKKTRGLDIKESWVHLVSIYMIITLLSLIGGWLPGYLSKRGWTVTRARKTGFFIYALCFLPIFFVTQVGDWPAVFLIGLAGAAHQAWSANLFTTVSDMFPKYAIGSVVGIGGMAGAIGGMLFPVFSGRLLDIFTARGNVTGGYTVLFTICAFAYLIAFAIHHLLAPKFEKFQLK